MKYWCLNYFLVLTLLSGCSRNKTTKNEQLEIENPSGDSIKGKSIYNGSCQACHGKNAEGNHQLKSPALANTDDWYLYRQLIHFQKGYRGYLADDTLGLQMTPFAKALKDSNDLKNAIAYIKTKPEIKMIASIGDRKKGENIYQSICGSCHGPGARGNEKLNAPRLNGLNEWYLHSQVQKFKKGLRGSHPDDKLGEQMVPMVTLLHSEQEIDDVIAYILSPNQQGTK